MGKSKFLSLLFILPLFGFIIACSSGTSTTSSDSNALAQAFPTDMAVSSPFSEGSSTVGSMNVPIWLAEGDDIETQPNPADMTYEQKQELINDIMNATDMSDCFAYAADIFEEEDTVTCYGPELTITGTHPDGSIPGGSQNLPTGDIGIWTASEADGQACLAAKINSEFKGVTGKIDFAMLTMASVFCVANNSGVTLPAAGATLDLSPTIATAYDSEDSESAFDPITVNLTRESDTAEGNAVYSLAVTGNMVNNDESTNPVTFSMRHIPKDASNSTYQGLIQMTIVTADIPSTNCGAGDHTVGMSTLYEKASGTDLRVDFRQGVFCGEPGNEVVFDADGLADKTNYKSSGCPGGDSSDTSGWGDDFSEVVMNLNPSTGYGSIIYAWQAGRCDGNTRVFQATLSADGGEEGAEGGCGYFGFGDAIVEDQTPAISGMVCNWTAPGAGTMGNKTVQELVQRQCVTRASGATNFSSISSQLAVTYAPTNSCDQSSGLICDGVACPTTNTLLDFDSMSFTAPTMPSVLE